MEQEKKSVTILLVEDDPGHARLIEKNLRRSNIMNEIINLTDGKKAVDFLFGVDGAVKRPSPLLILLDLNIPELDGYQVLKRIKADERTRKIPVVMLTSTDDDREIKKCYELGCNVYVTKPVDYEKFADAIRKLGLFLSILQMPGEE
ncbi:MAG: response regulator [Nitrospinae bacterium]|nr:response regulator [Nitrospinota bacterium]MBF0634376.1 response regulator [Nitrospinota bacterium]